MIATPEVFFQAFLLSVIFVLGASIGSFLNVCVYRLPAKLSLLRPLSHCPACQKPIPWDDNIPVLSYLILKGKCRNCQSAIALRYFIFEALIGLLFVAFALKFLRLDTSPKLVAQVLSLALWVSTLVLLVVLRFEHKTLPLAAGFVVALVAWLFALYAKIVVAQTLPIPEVVGLTLLGLALLAVFYFYRKTVLIEWVLPSLALALGSYAVLLFSALWVLAQTLQQEVRAGIILSCIIVIYLLR